MWKYTPFCYSSHHALTLGVALSGNKSCQKQLNSLTSCNTPLKVKKKFLPLSNSVIYLSCTLCCNLIVQEICSKLCLSQLTLDKKSIFSPAPYRIYSESQERPSVAYPIRLITLIHSTYLYFLYFLY